MQVYIRRGIIFSTGHPQGKVALPNPAPLRPCSFLSTPSRDKHKQFSFETKPDVSLLHKQVGIEEASSSGVSLTGASPSYTAGDQGHIHQSATNCTAGALGTLAASQ